MDESTESGLRDLGLLLLRLSVGVMFIVLGYPILFGGHGQWADKGAAMANLGVKIYPEFWGFMAGFAEFAGGICLVVGLFFRPMAALMVFTMVVAIVQHFHNGDPFMKMALAIAFGTVALSLLLMGPGMFALGHILWGKSKKKSGKKE